MRRVRRVLGYARVSGAEQGRTGTSLAGQQEEIRRYCAANGFPEPDIRIEVESAGAEKLERRAVLRQLLADVSAGDLVVVAKQDRWSRDTLFFLQSVRDLNARGAHFLSIAERFDPETSEGRFAATLMAAVAEQERERIIDRTVGRRRVLRNQGRYVDGKVPLGYQRGPGNILEIVPASADVVRELYRRCSRGASLAELTAWVRAEHPEYGRDKQVLHKILRSRHYLGEIQTTSKGVWMKAHEPIVTQALYERAQKALASRRLGGRKPRDEARTASWLLRGGLGCCARCGARLSSAYQGKLNYYACWGRLKKTGCRAPYVRVEPADVAVGELVLERLAQLRVELGREPSTPPPAGGNTAGQQARLEKRRERLIDFAGDGTITREELRRRLVALDDELAALRAVEAARAAQEAARRPELRAELLRDVEQLRRAWKGATVAQRREVVARLAVSVGISAGGPPAIEWRTVADLVTEPS